MLLLHATSPDANFFHPIHGILYDPTHEDTSNAGPWFIGRLLDPLGSGWYYVRAYPGLD